MIKHGKLMTALVLISMLIFLTGCNRTTTEPSVDEFLELKDYLTANGLDLPALLTDWLITAEDIINNGIEHYYIIDIRERSDYVLGHVPGSVNVALADVVTHEEENNAGTLAVVVVSYTGQAAGHAVAALRLNGIGSNVMKWGMSGWHSDFDEWSGNTGNAAVGSAGWSEDGDPEPQGTYDYPVFVTENEDGADILADQIENTILDGFKFKTIDEVLENYADYQVVNYWSIEDWNYYGHITGAYQVDPGALNLETMSMLDPETPIVFYCWTGHTASVIVAWLNLLGYEAYDLKFSANGLIYNDLEKNKWNVYSIPDFDYETGS